MRKFFAPAACAAAILLSSVSIDAILAPAAAQGDVDFDSFHDYLANYGAWVYSDRWGEVWIPQDVPDDFQPYGTNGYWAATDNYGWVWVSNYEWGDVPFHYGRWVNDPDTGWLWIPGYVWSPAWVVWRNSGQYTGWMPMPPDPVFLGQSGPSAGIGISLGDGISIGIDFNDTSSYYGYSQWYGPSYGQAQFAQNWVFVGTGHMADRNFQQYAAPRGNYVNIIHNTTNITNYTVVNNYIVNRGVDVNVVQRAGGHPVVKVHLNQVIKHPQFIAQANVGAKIQTRMRQENPRGSGVANSAPKLSPQRVQGLSNKVPQHNGHPPAGVFTKATVAKAPAFTGAKGPQGGAAPEAMHGPGGMKGPNAGAPNTTPNEKFRKPGGETGTGMRGPSHTPEEKNRAPGGAMSAPETTKTAPGAMHGPEGGGSMPMRERRTPESAGGRAAPTDTMMMRHKPESTGGAAPTEPMMRRKPEATGGGMEGGGAPAVQRRTPPPVMHKAAPPKPEEHKAPPPKPEDKKDKPDHG